MVRIKNDIIAKKFVLFLKGKESINKNSNKVSMVNKGVEFIGLYGTLSNILGYLNLAELGIAGCIS